MIVPMVVLASTGYRLRMVQYQRGLLYYRRGRPKGFVEDSLDLFSSLPALCSLPVRFFWTMRYTIVSGYPPRLSAEAAPLHTLLLNKYISILCLRSVCEEMACSTAGSSACKSSMRTRCRNSHGIAQGTADGGRVLRNCSPAITTLWSVYRIGIAAIAIIYVSVR
jgi:hypothetical protein